MDAMEQTMTASEPSPPVGPLRGAGVDVDVRRVGAVLVGACAVALAVCAVVFYIAAFHNNSQINSLRQHGVASEVKVTTCIGLIGGSGSNPVGYSCKGMITAHGRVYDVNIPGSSLHAPGALVKVIAVPGDPPLLSTVHVVAGERASWKAFILPTSLLVVLVLLVAAIVWRRSRRAQLPR